MRRLLLTLLLTATALAQPPNADVGQLRSVLQKASQQAGTRAVEFGMWIGDREILTTALGNSMTSVPASTDMHWRIGGFSELFQSTLLMMLVDRGRIDLDQKISKWFPDLLGADKVTVRMLVTCTAGYPDYVVNSKFVELATREPYRQFTDDELIAYAVEGGKLNFEPGSSQRYSHSDLVILGQVLQRATGQSMKELYEIYITGPLELKDTQVPVNQEIQAPVLHAFSSDRGVYEDCTYYNPSWGSVPGLLTSNLQDLGKWGRIFGTGALVSPESWKTMTAPGSVGLGGNRSDLYFCYAFVYANGWYVQNPSMNGYSGGIAYNPSNGVTLVVGATAAEKPAIDPGAFYILKEIVKYVTPGNPINF